MEEKGVVLIPGVRKNAFVLGLTPTLELGVFFTTRPVG
jgi:hypothetical protein